MCKSVGMQAACFSQVLPVHSAGDGGSDNIARHGCVELMPPLQRDSCSRRQHRTQPHRSHNSIHQRHDPIQVRSNFSCCSEDMCNYVRVDSAALAPTTNNNNVDSDNVAAPSKSFSTLIWFRIAVITVPIAGSFVLVLLILLAAKVLRQDTKRQRHSAEMRKQRQFKTNLFLHGNSYRHHRHHQQVSDKYYCGRTKLKPLTSEPRKNQINAKINDLKKKCDNHSMDSNILYNKNINLAFSDEPNSSLNEDGHFSKENQLEKSSVDSLYNSLLTFGKWESMDKEVV